MLTPSGTVKSRMVAAAVLSVGLVLASCAFGDGRDSTFGLIVAPDLSSLDGDTFIADGIIDPDRVLYPGHGSRCRSPPTR